MTLPNTIETRTITFGSATSYAGNDATITGAVTANQTLIHQATGTRICPDADPMNVAGGMLTLDLPIVDQAGFVNAQQNEATNWLYTLSYTIRYASGGSISGSQDFQLFSTDPSVVDLDVRPNGPVVAGVTTSQTSLVQVAGLGGPVIEPEDLAAALESDLSRAFVRSVPMPAPSGVAAFDAAALTAALAVAAAVVAQGGRPVVEFQSGTYLLNAGVPVVEGVAYRGVTPVIHQQTDTSGVWLADGGWDYIGGTIIKGDGSGPCFAANSTPVGAVPASIGTTQISSVTIEGFGVDGYTTGLYVGEKNTIGLVYSKLNDLFFKNCSDWSVKLINFAHCEIGRIYSCLGGTSGNGGGQLYASYLPGATFLPANSVFREVYHLKNGGAGARTERGIVFEAAGTSAGWGQALVDRLQVNAFNGVKLSVSAGFTNTSTSVTVPDGSLFRVGMLVSFTSSNYGINPDGGTKRPIYVVKSVTANVLTLAVSKSAAAFTATGTGTLTLETYGFPNIEIAGVNTGTAISGCRFLAVDSEGAASAGIYLENLINTEVTMVAVPGSSGGGLMDIVGRNCANSRVASITSATNDFDTASNTTEYGGIRGAIHGKPIPGTFRDSVYGGRVQQINAGNFLNDTGGDLAPRANGFLYPGQAGMGEHVYARNGSAAFNGTQCGVVIIAAAGATTQTLPTINDDSNPLNSHIGLWFEIWNTGTGTITLNTNGTQLFNTIAAKTSLTIAAGNGVKVVAGKDANGTLTWLARPFALST